MSNSSHFCNYLKKRNAGRKRAARGGKGQQGDSKAFQECQKTFKEYLEADRRFREKMAVLSLLSRAKGPSRSARKSGEKQQNQAPARKMKMVNAPSPGTNEKVFKNGPVIEGKAKRIK